MNKDNTNSNNKSYKLKDLIENEDLQKEIYPYSKSKFATINPSNNKLVKEYDFDSDDQIKEKIKKAHESFLNLRENYDFNSEEEEKVKNYENLKKKFIKLADILVEEETKNKLAKTISLEMGKPIKESIGEVEIISQMIKYFTENSSEFLKKKDLPEFKTFKNYVIHEPLGVILCITPWNFPLAMPIKNAVPAILSRNTIIWKPPHNNPQCGLELLDCFKRAGFENEFQVVFTPNDGIENIIKDDRVRYVFFTGSTNAGKKIGELSGKYIKRSLLELGGSDPMLILEDVKPEVAVEKIIGGRINVNGQVCCSTKRAIISDKIYDQVKKILKEKLDNMRIGDALDKNNEIGPLSRFDLMISLYKQSFNYLDEETKNKDIKLNDGNFFKPIIIENPEKNSVPYKEELFGPTITMFKADSVDKMIEIANDVEYGLSSVVITNDEKKAKEIVKRLETGMTFINTPYVLDARLPFGGYKNSGFGRANYKYIFDEISNLKTITINQEKL